MSKLKIFGGEPMRGSLDIYGAKNSCLPLFAACILTNKPIVLKNVPLLNDVKNMGEILTSLGCRVKFKDGDVYIDSSDANSFFIPPSLAKEIRSSIFMLGSMLSRFKKAKISYPGGCDIGNRPIDLHIKGLRDLNVKIKERHGFIECDGSDMKAGVVHLDYPSVGATENIIMASVFNSGVTTIINPAKEPEIVDLANFLNQMGAKVYGAGSAVITIEGVRELRGVSYKPIGDRIVAGTYLIAGAMTGGDVELNGINPEFLYSLTTKLVESGCQVDLKNDKIHLKATARPKSAKLIETMPYPGFPTDLQAPMLALQTVCDGTSVITENLFESRFKHVAELKKMGAKITVKDRMAIVEGVPKLYGAEVFAEDLRGGASLVLAGLVADGYTEVNNVKHIDRGYYKIEDDLASLGAKIERID